MKVKMKVVAFVEGGAMMYQVAFQKKEKKGDDYSLYEFRNGTNGVMSADLNNFADGVYSRCLEIYTDNPKAKIKVA